MKSLYGMPGIIRVDHIGVAVKDLDAAINWYSSFLGGVLLSREINTEQMIEEATLELGGTHFQIISPSGDLSPIKKFLSTRGEGIQQIAFQVANLESAIMYANEMGVHVVFDSPKIGTGGSRINFLHPRDCFGVLIELVELLQFEK